MGTRVTAAVLNKPIALPDKAAVGMDAAVEITGFPQVLYTRMFGDPDTLFVPLLDASRDSCQMIERLCAQGEERQMATTLSTMQLASSLMRDASFTAVVKGRSHETFYCVDLDGNMMRLSTRLYAVIGNRTSLFKVVIIGKISEGQFEVHSHPQNQTLTRVNEKDLRRPDFFSKILAPQCLRAQIQQERIGPVSEAPAYDAHAEVQIAGVSRGGKISVVLRRNESLKRWDIVDGRTHECVGALSAETERSLGQVFTFLQELFS